MFPSCWMLLLYMEHLKIKDHWLDSIKKYFCGDNNVCDKNVCDDWW